MDEGAAVLDIDDGVATITLNRPERQNALTVAVMDALGNQFERVRDSDASVLVVEGRGEAFCAGGDLEEILSGHAAEYAVDEWYELIGSEFNRVIRRLVNIPVPTVAKIDGIAFGGGASIATACDVQLASSEAEMSFGFEQLGLAVDTGVSFLLPRLVGLNTALELVYTGEIVPAERAERLGLVNHVYPAVEFEERATGLVESIADGPDQALRHSKRLVRDGLEADLDRALANEAATQVGLLNSTEHEEALQEVVGGEDSQ